jgi:hypothetical protein
LHKFIFMQAILVVHSLLRWAVLIFGFFTVLNALTGVIKKRVFTESDNKSNLLFMISCDIQLLLGIILYFNNGWWDMLKNFSQIKGNAYSRFFAMEHLSMMVLAWILVHVGRAAVKRTEAGAAKHKKMLLYFGLAFVLILSAIPWPGRGEIARPLFNWF